MMRRWSKKNISFLKNEPITLKSKLVKNRKHYTKKKRILLKQIIIIYYIKNKIEHPRIKKTTYNFFQITFGI